MAEYFCPVQSPVWKSKVEFVISTWRVSLSRARTFSHGEYLLPQACTHAILDPSVVVGPWHFIHTPRSVWLKVSTTMLLTSCCVVTVSITVNSRKTRRNGTKPKDAHPSWCVVLGSAHAATPDGGHCHSVQMLGVLSGSGQRTEGIRLPSGILTTSLCHQTASSTFPPHIFLYLLLFHPLIPPLSSLLPCTVNLLCAHVHARTHTHTASTAHTNILMPLSLLSAAKLVSLFSVVFSFSMVSFVLCPATKDFCANREEKRGGWWPGKRTNPLQV